MDPEAFDIFLVKSSGKVVNYLKDNNLNCACSFEVEACMTLFRMTCCLHAMKGCIEENGRVSFQNACGVSVNTCRPPCLLLESDHICVV